jgi:signal transduction histidine kinase
MIVEDSPHDAVLVVRELTRAGFVVHHVRVETDEQMRSALAREKWDLVIADYSMPQFTAVMALTVLKESGRDVPFIVVSGVVSEESAVDAIRQGAHDFMPKGVLARLVPAVHRELAAALRTERRELRDQLMVSSARLASIGVITAGVGHEINNPLACVMANLELASRDVAQLSEQFPHGNFGELSEELRDALEAAERIRNIVRDLRSFSRPQAEPLCAVNVRDAVASTLRLAAGELRHRARVVTCYADTPAVFATEARLIQVLLNLVINAAQAIGDRGVDGNEIRVSTSVTETGDVAIAVSDTGPGIAESDKAKIFAPFFTTKPIGQGTGLGIAICERIVRGFGGTIEVESELGSGATFRVLLKPAVGQLPV